MANNKFMILKKDFESEIIRINNVIDKLIIYEKQIGNRYVGGELKVANGKNNDITVEIKILFRDSNGNYIYSSQKGKQKIYSIKKDALTSSSLKKLLQKFSEANSDNLTFEIVEPLDEQQKIVLYSKMRAGKAFLE